MDQLKETYGLPDSTFQKIKKSLVVQTPHRFIPINEVSYKDLAKHPYINRKTARAIINYRIQHGDFKLLADLQKIILLDSTSYQKIQAYISF